MKEQIVIASYGGSGSTFLSHQIGEHGRYLPIHTHACPPEGATRLGIPVFNRYTGGVEGPFSKSSFLAESTKIIIIVRKPSEAYDSRASFKHFCHLWSETEYFNKIFDERDDLSEPMNKIFQKHWKDSLNNKKDVLNLDGWLRKWRDFAVRSNHDIYFLKYEDIVNKEPEISNFLEFKFNLDLFKHSVRIVKPLTSEIFCEIDENYKKLESKQISTSSETVREKKLARVNKKNIRFHIKGLKAGAGDSLNRLAKVYNFLKCVFDADVTIEPYVNYHCKDLDFFKLYGVGNIIKVSGLTKNAYPLSVMELSFYTLYDQDYFKENVVYELDLMNQDQLRFIDRLVREFKVKESFFKYLEYKPHEESSKYFNDDAIKIVAHLRRNDIIGKIFAPEIKKGPIGKHGLHARRLVTWNDIENIIEENNYQKNNIEIVLISDGISEKIISLAENEAQKRALLDLQDELKFGGPKSKSIKVVKRIIGNKLTDTLHSLDAMFYADLVVSGSSVFPNVICHIGRTKLLKVE